MDEDIIIMKKIQDELMGLLSKYPNHTLQSLAMVLKTAIDCYVSALGEENTEEILNVAIDSVKNGKHSVFSQEISKKSLH